MIGNEITFSVSKRTAYGAEEWCLWARFKDKDRWVLKTWTKEPSPEVVQETKDLVLRSFRLYHEHIIIPPFRLRVTE